METSLNQIRIDACLSEGGIPFEVRLSTPVYKSPEGMRAFMALRQEAEDNGLSDMTLDEINAEINAARAERKKKAGECRSTDLN